MLDCLLARCAARTELDLSLPPRRCTFNVITDDAFTGQALNDHAAANVDWWWEWTEAGGLELKDRTVPKVVPLQKKPRVITIGIDL